MKGMKVELTDYLGYTIGAPDIPEPLPCVIVWGQDFFLAFENDATKRARNPKYIQVTGHVLIDTRESSKYF